MKEKISAVIITKNEEDTIDECLSHLSWADEVIIVDGASTDKTKQKALKFKNVKFFENNFVDFSRQRNFAASRASGNWILSIDADEVVTEELKGEILDAIKKEEYSAFEVPIKNIFYGKWLKYGGWYPFYKRRLYRRDDCFWESSVHEKIEAKGRVGKLKEAIIHNGHKTVNQTIQKHNFYTDMEAMRKFAEGDRFSVFKLVASPVKTFVNRYLLQLGFLDGMEGFIVNYFMACYQASTWIKTRELERKNKI